MKLKSAISLLFLASLSVFFSACSSAESKEQSEVVIDKSSTGATKTDEVYITNADVKKATSEDGQVSTVVMPGGSSDKSTLSDSSQVETLTDAFGNKVQTRYFAGNPRIRMLVMRTSVKGVQEVTVYGNGGDTKLVNGLADRALTASGDEIADAAGLYSTTSAGAAKNYLKRQPSQSSSMQQPLQPLPSSAFQQPAQSVNQPTGVTSRAETTTTQPANPEEDED